MLIFLVSLDLEILLNKVKQFLFTDVYFKLTISESLFGDNYNFDNDLNDKQIMDTDPDLWDKDYLIKQYHSIKQKYNEISLKYDKLVVVHQKLKENSLRKHFSKYLTLIIFLFPIIAMPCDAGRKWLVQVGKIVGPKSSQISTETIAEKLGIPKPSSLTSCIRDTASNTTRQVIKLLYSPAELKVGRGKNVPQEKRKLIRGKISFKISIIKKIIIKLEFMKTHANQ